MEEQTCVERLGHIAVAVVVAALASGLGIVAVLAIIEKVS